MVNERKRRGKWQISRDSILFVLGLAGIFYETLLDHTDRPTLLILFAAMVGLPAFLSADERKNGNQGGPPQVETFSTVPSPPVSPTVPPQQKPPGASE